MTALARAAAVALVAATLPLALTGVASAKTTHSFSFESKGTAVNPQATGDPNDPTTYEDHPFTIGHNDRDGTINVHIDWLNPADDWDLYVYRKGAGGKLQTVAQSAGGAPDTEENAVGDSQGIPWKAGVYVIRVVNYAAVLPSYSGTARFGPFIPYNQIPIAKLKAPSHAKKGQRVTLDASASRDPDGKIVNFAFDLDGNGSMEVKNGKSPILKRVLSPGTHHVAVRVIDNGGLRAFANRTVVVSK
jgi:PKD domain-containing protein